MKKVAIICFACILTLFIQKEGHGQEFYLGVGALLHGESNDFDGMELTDGYFLHALYAKRITPKAGFGVQINYIFNAESAWTSYETYNSVEISPMFLWNPFSSKLGNVETGITLGTHLGGDRFDDPLDPDDDELSSPYVAIPIQIGNIIGKFRLNVGGQVQLTKFADGGFRGTIQRPFGLRIALAYRII